MDALIKKIFLDGLQKQEVSTNSTGKDANENLKNSVLSLEKGSKKYLNIWHLQLTFSFVVASLLGAW